MKRSKRRVLPIDLSQNAIDRIDDLVSTLKKAARHHDYRPAKGEINRSSIIRLLVETGMDQEWIRLSTLYGYERNVPINDEESDPRDRSHRKRGREPKNEEPKQESSSSSAVLPIEIVSTVIENVYPVEEKDHVKHQHGRIHKRKISRTPKTVRGAREADGLEGGDPSTDKTP